MVTAEVQAFEKTVEEMKEKKPAKIEHLVNWYFGNFCAKCGRIDMDSENYGKKCYDKMQKIKDNINIKEMAHKEFVNIIRNTSFCKPLKRMFHKCKICEALGVPQERF